MSAIHDLPSVLNSNLDPTARWKEKSAPCDKERRIMQVAMAVLAAVGAAVEAFGIYGLATMSIHPAVAGIAVGVGLPLLLIGAIFFSLYRWDQSDNYANPETVKNIVKNLREKNLDKAFGIHQVDALVTNGIIPEEHSCEIKDFIARYSEVCREEGRGTMFCCRMPLEKQAELVQRKVAINAEWIQFRERVNLAANMPQF